MLVSDETPDVGGRYRRVLLLPTLLLCVSLTYTFPVFASTLLVDLAPNFKVSIGTASLLETIVFGMIIIMGLTMSAMTLRFKHKSLLLFGITIYSVGALGFFLAKDFAAAILFSFFLGTGAGIVTVLVYALIGDLLSLKRRAWAIGLVLSSFAAITVIVAPLSGFIDSFAGWRSVLLWLIFPFSLLCLALASAIIPTKQTLAQSTTKPSTAKAFKEIFMNKSPTVCVVSALLLGFANAISVYAVSFYRTAFSVSPTIGGAFASIAAIGGIVGGATSGRFVNRYGRKQIAVIAIFVLGISCILFTFVPLVAFSVAFWVVTACAGNMGSSGQGSLSMEQIPEYKSSMMSINVSFTSFGTVLGILMGALVLNLFHNNFHLLMVIIGALVVSAAALLFFFARDPCKTDSTLPEITVTSHEVKLQA